MTRAKSQGAHGGMESVELKQSDNKRLEHLGSHMLGRKFRLDEGHRELSTGSEQKDDLITPGLQKDYLSRCH